MQFRTLKTDRDKERQIALRVTNSTPTIQSVSGASSQRAPAEAPLTS